VKLATIRTAETTSAVRIELDSATAVLLDATDVGALLADPLWRSKAADADGIVVSLDSIDYAPLIPRPDKIVCVGLNYRTHILEMGHDTPSYPTLFAKYRSSLIGANDDIVLPAVSTKVDWECELAIIIGSAVRHADEQSAAAAIAGYSILNDVSARDWQNRTSQFLQGKTFESSTPLGPWLVTADELDAAPGPLQRIVCEVDGETMQDSTTDDLLFDCRTIVSYISTIMTLLPGDVIATGTPSGVGAGRSPQRFLQHGNLVVSTISGLGELRNRCVREVLPG